MNAMKEQERKGEKKEKELKERIEEIEKEVTNERARKSFKNRCTVIS